MDASTAAHTHLLGTYRVGAQERQVLALETDEDGIFAMATCSRHPWTGVTTRMGSSTA
jgi:hypothetical protein